MKINKNLLLVGSNNKPMATDIFYIEDGIKKPVVIYAHGFNGFKDWANFDIIARQFAEAGFVFIKFNFSHNGTTPTYPEEFVDLQAYAENNYTKELYDLQVVIDWALDPCNQYAVDIDPAKLSVLGHSRGGGIAILKAAEEKRVCSLVTWASVSESKTPWSNWSQDKLDQWQQTGVQHYPNSRTKQQMPLHYQLFQDYYSNTARLNILNAMANLDIPVLICHGTSDEAVPVSKAYQLKNAKQGAELYLIDTDHVFGRKHPWQEPNLPSAMQQVLDKTIAFYKATLPSI